MLGIRVAATFAVTVVMSIIAAAPGGAQEAPERAVSVNPSSAYTGQPFDVAGTGCAGEEGTGTRVTVELQHVESGIPTAWSYRLALLSDEDIHDNGDWSVTVAIPVDHPQLSEVLDPDDEFEIGARCRYPCVGGIDGSCETYYEGVPFDVVPAPDAAPEDPTPTTVDDPQAAPSPTAGSPAVVPAAAPATPITANPTYTG